MTRFVLLNCMGSHMVADKRDCTALPRFFRDHTIGGDARREYTFADKAAVVDMFNEREAPPKVIRFACENVINDRGTPCGDEGRMCDTCSDEAAAEHAYLRYVPRHAVFNDAQAIAERNAELRDCGRGHLVSA